jgi:hypothetical protein
VTVYVVLHEDGESASIRAVYSTREAAEAARVDRTRTGRRSSAWEAHQEWCCRVVAVEVEGTPPCGCSTTRSASSAIVIEAEDMR